MGESESGGVIKSLSMPTSPSSLVAISQHSRILIHSGLGRQRDDFLLGVHLLRFVIDSQDGLPLFLHGHSFRFVRHGE